jgi:hypothetical protein
MTNQLNVQKLLRDSADGMAQLRELGISIKQHAQYPELHQFTYSMTESYSVKDHPLVCECRGLMLSADLNWAVVARPFDRFFNLGETGASAIDWSTARIQEKLDGTLMVLYHYANQWHVNTKNTPGANVAVGDWSITFAELFWRCWTNQYGLDALSVLNTDCTYCWELTSAFNRVVTIADQEKITLIGARMNSGAELDVRDFANQFDVVKHYDFNTEQAAVAAAEQLDPLVTEGYVVVDQQFKRVKIKSPRYVALHCFRFSCSVRNIIENIQKGEIDELLTYFPEMKQYWQQCENSIQQHADQIDYWFAQLVPYAVGVITQGDRMEISASRKTFAAAVKQMVPSKYHGAMFARVLGHATSGRNWLLSQPVSAILPFVNCQLKLNSVQEAE